MYFELGVSATLTSSMFFWSMLASSLSQTLVWGRVSDRFKIRRDLIVIGEVFAAFAHILLFEAHKFAYEQIGAVESGIVIIIGMTIIEFIWSSSNVGWSALFADLTTEKTRSKLIGVLSSLGGAGTIVGSFLAAYLYNQPNAGEGFRSGTIFYATAILIMVSAILVRVLLPEPLRDQRRIHKEIVKSSTREQKLPRMYYFFIIASTIYFIGLYSFFIPVVLYARLPSTFGASETQIALLRSSGALATMAIGPVVSIIATKFGANKGILFSTLFVAASVPFFIQTNNYGTYLVFVMLLSGMTNAASQFSYLIAARIIPREIRGKGFGYYNGLIFFSFGAGGLLITGPIIDYTLKLGFSEKQSFQWAFIGALIATLIGLVMHFPVFSKYPDQTSLDESKVLSEAVDY